MIQTEIDFIKSELSSLKKRDFNTSTSQNEYCSAIDYILEQILSLKLEHKTVEDLLTIINREIAETAVETYISKPNTNMLYLEALEDCRLKISELIEIQPFGITYRDIANTLNSFINLKEDCNYGEYNENGLIKDLLIHLISLSVKPKIKVLCNILDLCLSCISRVSSINQNHFVPIEYSLDLTILDTIRDLKLSIIQEKSKSKNVIPRTEIIKTLIAICIREIQTDTGDWIEVITDYITHRNNEWLI